MQISDTRLPGIRLIRLRVHHDSRGYFLETWQSRRYSELLGNASFVQHNQSLSRHGVVRGMHYQRRHGQGKLIRVLQGRVLDVAVDLRAGSPTFGQWLAIELNGINPSMPDDEHRQLWIPPGFAHGFQVLSDQAIVEYLCTDFYDPGDEVCLSWNDPDVGIAWSDQKAVLSPRDRQGLSLRELESAGLLPGIPPSSGGVFEPSKCSELFKSSGQSVLQGEP